MKPEDHRLALKESLHVIKEAIQAGIELRQRTIGFHCSAAAVDLLELFLHELNVINPGKVIKHDFFCSEREARSKLPEEFPDKDKIIILLVTLEIKRNHLCYGKIKQKEDVENYLKMFREIQKFFDAKGVKYEF